MLFIQKKIANKIKWSNFFGIIVVSLCLLSCKTNLNLTQIKTENIPISEKVAKTDSSIEKLVAPYRQSLEADMNVVVTKSKYAMVKGKPESLLTNYLGDLLLEQGKLYAKRQVNQPAPVVSYMNYGGIRAGLPKGDVTVKDVFEIMPFENEMVLIRVTGVQLKAFADHIAKIGGDCISGMRIVMTADGKITSLKVNGKAVNPTEDYWLITNDYVANGGDRMFQLTSQNRYVGTGIKLRDLFINTMKKEYQSGVSIAPKLDGRISYE